MNARVACRVCGAMILSATAERNRGECLSCFHHGQPHDAEKELGKLRVLSLEEYFTLVEDVPLPTLEQRRSFVEYVCGAHSWYKHLPRFWPGLAFYFFIDRF